MGISRETIQRGIILSVSISIIALVLVMVLTQNEFTIEAFQQINPDYLVMAAAITIGFWILKSLKLQILIRALGGDVLFHRVFGIYLASLFVAHVTPSSFGGLPFQIYFFHREGLKLGKTTALTVLDGMLTVIVFMLTTPVLLLLWGGYLNFGPGITRLFYIATLLVVVFMVISFLFIFNVGLAKSFINWLVRLKVVTRFFAEKSLIEFKKFIETELESFNQGMRLLTSSGNNLILVICYTVLYWVFYLSLAPVLLKGLGLQLAVPPVILAQLVFNYIQPIIPTPGGSGGAELGFAYLFKFMVPDFFLGVFVISWRFFMFYLSLIFGGLFFINLVQGTDYLKNK